MQLFVVRHARAEDRLESRWPTDADRPLTDIGRAEFAKLARRTGRSWEPPALVLASPFERAWETAKILRDEAGWPKPTKCACLQADHDGGVAAIEQEVVAHAVASLALVGHEPVLSELVSHLIGTDLPSVVMRKGTVAVLDLAVSLREAADAPGLFGSATLLSLVDPRAVGMRE